MELRCKKSKLAISSIIPSYLGEKVHEFLTWDRSATGEKLRAFETFSKFPWQQGLECGGNF